MARKFSWKMGRKKRKESEEKSISSELMEIPLKRAQKDNKSGFAQRLSFQRVWLTCPSPLNRELMGKVLLYAMLSKA